MYKNNSYNRCKIAQVNIWGTTQLHLRNPFVIACWSAAFPGTGHLLLSEHLKGILLFIMEIVINAKANLNVAILYTFTGKFEMAKEVLNIRWLLIYCSVYVFSIWDSYRTTIGINNNYILAEKEDAEIKPFKTNGLNDVNYMDKRIPWLSVVWSLGIPGLGQLYINRIITATFILIWFLVIIYFSKLLPAIHYTFIGDFNQAKSIVNPQWLLNIASVYLFAMYDAYTKTVEHNKLYAWEQSKFLKKDYHNINFNIPSKRRSNRGDKVHIIATFEHSIYLEKAIKAIQMKGIPKEDILAVSLDTKSEERKLLDSRYHSDGMNLLDLASILGTILMLLGTIYGFELKWGPIFWGLVGLVAGFSIGLIIKLIFIRKYSSRQIFKKSSEVVLIIECREDKLEIIKNIFWENYALGISNLSLNQLDES